MEKIVRKPNRMQQEQINDVYSDALSSPQIAYLNIF